MTKKEAIVNLIEKKPVGYTPHHFDLTMKITDDLAQHYRMDSEDIEDWMGNHFLYVDFGAPKGQSTGYRHKGEDRVVVDEFGVSWDNAKLYGIGDWAMIDHPIRDLDLTGYVFPDGRGEGRYVEAEEQMRRFPGRFNVLRMTGLLDNCWHLTGLEDFLVAMVTEPDLAHEVMDRCADYMIHVIESAPESIDAVRFIEDWGMQKGLLFSRELWLAYLKPRLQRIHAACRKKGFYVMHHSCGDVTDLFPDIIELGIDIMDAIQPESMDVQMLKREYGEDIVFFGGLGAQSTIPFGTPEQVVEEAEEALHTLGQGGGYIIGPAGSISTDTPIENVVALVEFCMKLQERRM